jgi:hypothetical protein
MPKKILIVSRSFYPTNSPRSFRTTELAKELAREGHDVKVITSFTQEEIQQNFAREHNIKLKDLGQIRSSKLIENLPNKLKRIFKRILQIVIEYPDIKIIGKVKQALKGDKGYDLLISVAVPHPIHWGIAKVWKKGSNQNPAKVWVADCGDPFMKVTLDTFKHPFYLKHFEKSFCHKCDYISVPTKASVQGYYKEFHHKIKIIPQGFKYNINDYKKLYKPNSVKKFIFAGNIIPGKRDPRPLLDFLLEQDVDFKFILYTTKKDLIKSYEEKTNKVEVKDYIPREMILKELAQADFLLNINNGLKIQTPSKLIDYHIAGRPILSIDSFDFDKKTVNEFLNGDYANAYKFENPDQFKIENVAQKFLSLIE